MSVLYETTKSIKIKLNNTDHAIYHGCIKRVLASVIEFTSRQNRTNGSDSYRMQLWECESPIKTEFHRLIACIG